MLKITVFGTLIVTAAALRTYGERYVFFFKEPSPCGGECPTSSAYPVCGSGQCIGGACGNWIKGYDNYCCSVTHEASLSDNCSDPLFKETFAKFSFDTSGTPAEEGEVSCPAGGGFIGDGIRNKEGISCCNLDKDGFILYQNASFPSNTEGDPTKARCIDPIVPIAAQESSTSSPTSATSAPIPTRTVSDPTGTSASTGSSATTSPNAASSHKLAAAMGVLPVFVLLAMYL
ncbi:hypothetical protein H072_10216 [Dactylellina haptotyla CBS 200.50]|uniref:Uncharacterized protein n=1 Tax=Dactylellina haptotyla (strain CBS 200.50) TaxID=1284197 RepID=S8BLZ0_DACHA|nr:hypothetical protein H072_10216 [Dactylellina haptotyla CBS 200.50]